MLFCCIIYIVSRASNRTNYSINTTSTSQIYAPNKRGEPPQYCTVFNHMAKSGVTTIKQQLVLNSNRKRDAKPGMYV